MGLFEKLFGLPVSAEFVTEKRKYNGALPPNCVTCISIFKFATKVALTFLGIGFLKIRKIQEKKVRHCHAMEILNEMVESEPSYKHVQNVQHPDQELKPKHLVNVPESPPHDEENEIHHRDQQKDDSKKGQNQSGENKSDGVIKDTPILVAAKMGIPDMVKKILCAAPLATQDQDSEGKNVVMLATENRHTNVFEFLVQSNPPDFVFHHVDNERNTSFTSRLSSVSSSLGG